MPSASFCSRGGQNPSPATTERSSGTAADARSSQASRDARERTIAALLEEVADQFPIAPNCHEIRPSAASSISRTASSRPFQLALRLRNGRQAPELAEGSVRAIRYLGKFPEPLLRSGNIRFEIAQIERVPLNNLF